ncbi:MAG: protealysin inhibitor emfourin [Propionibacteriaceae bacterium]
MACTFVPPYLLQRLAAVDTDTTLKSSGERTLLVDDVVRSRRDAPPRTIQQPAAPDDATRVVHDAHNTEELPGDVARLDSDPATGDAAVDEAFDSSGQVWDLFAEQFNRRSVDGNGTALSITVHYGQAYDNAFWDGQQLVFGDGDGEVFDRFTKPMDVMAHEFTHGVTQFTAGLAYQGQPGALNESVSDVFAALTKQKALKQSADQANWLIGEGLFRPGIKATALRSMVEPGSAYDDPRLGQDPQVGSMADYVDTEEDSGGVHINSGIPNRAFALAAREIGGNSWEQAGQVWYDAITSGEVSAATDFAGFARATVSSATRLFADDSRIAEAVRAAWTTVGVLTADQPTPAPTEQPPTPPVDVVAVRRSGGFAGIVRAGQLDLDADPEGAEVRSLLTQVDLRTLTASSPAPDRFVYTVEYGHESATLGEQDLTPELHRVVQIVLGPRGRLDLS